MELPDRPAVRLDDLGRPTAGASRGHERVPDRLPAVGTSSLDAAVGGVMRLPVRSR